MIESEMVLVRGKQKGYIIDHNPNNNSYLIEFVNPDEPENDEEWYDASVLEEL